MIDIIIVASLTIASAGLLYMIAYSHGWHVGASASRKARELDQAMRRKAEERFQEMRDRAPDHLDTDHLDEAGRRRLRPITGDIDPNYPSRFTPSGRPR